MLSQSGEQKSEKSFSSENPYSGDESSESLDELKFDQDDDDDDEVTDEELVKQRELIEKIERKRRSSRCYGSDASDDEEAPLAIQHKRTVKKKGTYKPKQMLNLEKVRISKE